ncbi:polyprenyl synthetase family protein [bacterium]|nr:polyprenyl synthetase family protein [bacterium]
MSTDLQQRLNRLKELIQPGLAAYAPEQEPISLYEPMRYALRGGGKQLRPLFLLLSCEAVGGRASEALPAALALELVHNFTLVHDDIMDHDELRHGRETVYKKWEESTAILAGDALLVQAFRALADVEAALLPRVLAGFTAGILEVCEGQALDKEFELRASVTLDEYYSMIAKKTGRLFSLACEIGGLLGHGTEQQVQGLKEYGACLGRAFQIQDDVLDLVSEKATLGKDIGSDIRENKKTFLMAYLFQYGAEEQQQQIHRLAKKNELSREELQQAVAVFTAAGALPSAETEIKRCIMLAQTALQPIENEEAKNPLILMLTTLAKRTF